ncbi:MAG: GDP-mannose 4,6-dehydratase, partial [Chloroflexota bacterium]
LWVNTTMQRNLLDSLILTRQNPCVVIAGSGDVYGNAAPELNPIHELVELRPANPYALSKAIQDLMGYQYWASHQLRIIRVRPFLQLGPRRDDRFVAGHFARQIAEIEADLREPIIRVGSIDLRRDFTDVRDVASAYIHAADHGVPGEAYNIASGVAHSLRDMLLIMLEHTRKPAEICTDPELVRPGEPALLIGDASKLRHLAGWAPTISFEQSVLDTVTYWENQVARDPVPSKGQS